MSSTNSTSSNKECRRVFVGISGGVDSAVSAALLLNAGYDVTGVYIKVWQPDWIECNWKEERRDAMRVAAHLGIPFVTFDAVAEYKRGVIDYMIREYASGRTPNPDVMCNREVKFGAFLKWARANGADFIATGHYAVTGHDNAASKNIVANFGKLFKSKDANKDQTYFLWTLTSDDLTHTIFPVGDMTKEEVRKLARDFGLPNADKKDSQGLCFIGKVDVKEFLSHYVKLEMGDVLDTSGRVIGSHNGALLFTIGERHGFTISEKTPEDKPLYVIAKDVARNTIMVAPKIIPAASYIHKSLIKISNANWIGYIPKVGDKLDIRARYRQPLVPAIIREISPNKETATFEPLSTIEAITPGQSLVAYLGEQCTGGGIIENIQ